MPKVEVTVHSSDVCLTPSSLPQKESTFVFPSSTRVKSNPELVFLDHRGGGGGRLICPLPHSSHWPQRTEEP